MIEQKIEEQNENTKAPWDAALIHAAPLNETVETGMDEMIVQEAPMGETIVYRGPGSVGETVVHEVAEDVTDKSARPSSLTFLDREESENLRTRWNEIQGRFVDEPASSVQQADELVTEVIEKITRMFGDGHSSLQGQWKQGNEITTEDLRKVLQRYRSFFNSLVA
jgi:hypothetical protein